MYKIPKDISLNNIVGECISQINVGVWDLQFCIGKVHFSIESNIVIKFNGDEIGAWFPGEWPNKCFRDIINVNAIGFEILDDAEVIIKFDNDYTIHLYDDSEQFESMQIVDNILKKTWII